MLMLAVNSVTEEVIYRAVAQPLLAQLTGQPWVAVGAVAVVFALAHRHFLRGPLLEGVEFLAYAVLLGALYYATGSLMLVIVVHTVRNFELYYQQFLIHAENLGSEAAAYAAQEKGGLPGRIPAKS
jgi:membrane protease YdiL (CAAX protease family)